MPVSGVDTSSHIPYSAPSARPVDAASGTEDKDMFLQLMVAQMRYQDPLNPTDSSQFLAQTAQFTSLEKMQQVADSTADLLAAQNAFGASSLVGRHVSWADADGVTTTGTVTGVSFGAEGPMLDVDGSSVSLGSVTQVVAALPGTSDAAASEADSATDTAA